MSNARLLLLLLITFLLTTVLGYVAVTGVIFGYWELTGVSDPDGGGAMAVGLVIAPVGALVIGVLATALSWPLYVRRQRTSSAPSPTATRRDQHLLLASAGLIVGLVAGFVVANAVQATLRPYIFDSRLVFWFFEHAHELSMPLCAVIGVGVAIVATRR